MTHKFGLEVEFGGDRTSVINSIRTHGLSDRTGEVGYMAHDTNGWVVKSDSSVSRGGELVGPPLDWDNPAEREQINIAFQALIDAGAHQEKTAGVHVHIDANDLTAKQVAAVCRTFNKYEDAIYRIATSGWLSMRPGGIRTDGSHRTGFCKPMEAKLIKKVAVAKTREQLGKAWYGTTSQTDLEYNMRSHSHGSRYHGLNLHSWFFRGTIEFRIFNSTMNAKRVMAYVALCQAIVQDARDGRQRSVNKRFVLGDMVAAGPPGSAERIKEEKRQIHHLCQMLRWENKTSPIPSDDLELIKWAWKNSVPQQNPHRDTSVGVGA